MTAFPSSASHLDPQDRDAVARAFGTIALEAGALIMQVYERGAVVRLKEDRSPVTDADEAAEALILERLAVLLPGIPVIAEERAARGSLPEVARQFVLVDPLDGTKEFLSRNGEFTVNIALIEDGQPIAGCVYAPAVDALYCGGRAAWRLREGVESPLHTRVYPAPGLTALCSRSHPDAASDAFLAGLPVVSRMEAGSSLKFCRIAEAAADVYPRFGPTMEWDIAAGHAVLQAAGGTLTQVDGRSPMPYGKRESGFRNTGFVAWGGAPVPR